MLSKKEQGILISLFLVGSLVSTGCGGDKATDSNEEKEEHHSIFYPFWGGTSSPTSPSVNSKNFSGNTNNSAVSTPISPKGETGIGAGATRGGSASS